jgi:hypothetical protein
MVRAADAARSEAPTTEALIEALDPEVRAAIDDVDRTLIALALQQPPWDRLRSASRMAQTLTRIRDAIASQGCGSFTDVAIASDFVPVRDADDEVDVTLIRWMLSLSPEERLAVLQGFVDSVVELTHDSPAAKVQRSA